MVVAIAEEGCRDFDTVAHDALHGIATAADLGGHCVDDDATPTFRRLHGAKAHALVLTELDEVRRYVLRGDAY